MIELSNTNAQTLAADQSITFDTVLLHTGCAEFHRPNSAITVLNQKNAIYEISFNCNIGATAAGDGEISIALNGATLPETTAKVVTAAAGDLQNVSAQTFVSTWCNGNIGNVVTLTNTGTTAINVDVNGRISVKRIA